MEFFVRRDLDGVEDAVVDGQETDGEGSRSLYIPSWRNRKRGRLLDEVTFLRP